MLHLTSIALFIVSSGMHIMDVGCYDSLGKRKCI